MMLRACRVGAWLIVIAAVIVAVIALTLPTRPRVAIVTDTRLPDSGLVDRVERALRNKFTVMRGSSAAGAASAVSVGYQLPADAGAVDGTVRAFAVLPEPRTPFTAIAAIA